MKRGSILKSVAPALLAAGFATARDRPPLPLPVIADSDYAEIRALACDGKPEDILGMVQGESYEMVKQETRSIPTMTVRCRVRSVPQGVDAISADVCQQHEGTWNCEESSTIASLRWLGKRQRYGVSRAQLADSVGALRCMAARSKTSPGSPGGKSWRSLDLDYARIGPEGEFILSVKRGWQCGAFSIVANCQSAPPESIVHEVQPFFDCVEE